MTTAVIDVVAASFLRSLLDDVVAGRSVLTRCEIIDDADGQRAVLAWGQPAATTAGAGTNSSHDHTIPAPLPPLTAPGNLTCGTCRGPVEVIPPENGGGLFCEKCDHSW